MKKCNAGWSYKDIAQAQAEMLGAIGCVMASASGAYALGEDYASCCVIRDNIMLSGFTKISFGNQMLKLLGMFGGMCQPGFVFQRPAQKAIDVIGYANT